jgi:hypothetical protein
VNEFISVFFSIILESREQPASKADNFTAICGPIV